MKDKVLKLFQIIIGVLILLYLYYIYSKNLTITEDFVLNYNLFFVVIVGIFALFIFIQGVLPNTICFKKHKLIQTLFGIFLILFSYYFLKDNIENFVFLSDILIVLGVLISILGPTGLCIPEVCKKEEQQKKIEIVEV